MVKLGLGDTYDNTIVNKKIRAYADLTKPASSIGVMMAVPFSTIFYGELYKESGISFMMANWETTLYACITLFLIHAGSQIMNMVEDAHIDKQTSHKQNRPIPAGVVSKEEARSLAWIFMFAGVARAFTVSSAFGMFSSVLCFFGIFYNLSPIRAKEHLWVNLIWQATSRGLLLYPATFAIWTPELNLVSWVMGVLSFMLVLSMQNSADFSDVEIDEEFGIITPAVYHGLDRLTAIMAVIVGLMFIFAMIAIQVSLIPNIWSLFLLVLPIGWSLLHLSNHPGNISSIGENNPTWYVFYICLASMYIIPAAHMSLM
jgi:4-hydroxybenzoate polyprenyltransferase